MIIELICKRIAKDSSVGMIEIVYTEGPGFLRRIMVHGLGPNPALTLPQNRVNPKLRLGCGIHDDGSGRYMK